MDVTDKIRPWMKECRPCPRNCGADRMAGQSCIFFRMFAGMQFLSEQKNIQGPEGKEDYTGTPGRTFFSIAGAGGK